jgi:formate hydrogenlyase subunit 3/multisubunit Na+/H+ antiporter MnhD subunit
MPPHDAAHSTHPAVRSALVHGAASLALLIGVVALLCTLPPGAPRSLAPMLMAADVIVTLALMTSGIAIALRRDRR